MPQQVHSSNLLRFDECTCCAKVKTFSANFLASYTPRKRNDNIFRPLVPVKNFFIPDQRNNKQKVQDCKF